MIFSCIIILSFGTCFFCRNSLIGKMEIMIVVKMVVEGVTLLVWWDLGWFGVCCLIDMGF